MRDIAEDIGHDRVAAVVDRFYSRIQEHPTLAGPFGAVEDWPRHKELLTHFWWASLGGERYLKHNYEVPRKHAEAGFTPELLNDWLALFSETLIEALPPELAEGWLARARAIGQSLVYLYNFQQNGRGPEKRLFTPA